MTEKMTLQQSAPIKADPVEAYDRELRLAGVHVHLRPASAPKIPVQRAAKRFIDAVGALFGLTMLAPAFPLIAILIKLESKGPVFTRQLHIGLNGAPFELLTFRSGRVKSSSSAEPIGGGKHGTPFGRFLRRTNLDALPRLWNVLVGDLSLIGPRPHVPDMLAAGRNYADLVGGYEYRNAMRPGLTGLAQTRGFHNPVGHRWMAIRQIVSDIEYIRNFSLLLDMKIVMQTAINAVKRRPLS